MSDRIEVDSSPFKPGGRFVRMDGTLTDEAYKFLDQLWQRTGGFSDEGWDSSAIAESLQTQIGDINTKLDALQSDVGFGDEGTVIDLLQRVEALESGLADTTEVSESALRQALSIDDANVLTNALKSRSLALNAATVIASATTTTSSDITSGTGTAKRTNSIAVTLTVDTGPDLEPGSEIAVLVDFEHIIESAAFNWVVMSHKLERYN